MAGYAPGVRERLIVVAHDAVSGERLRDLGALFDSEYLDEHGAWNPDRPYGYSPADVHTLAYFGAKLVGHVGYQRRTIAVGTGEVLIAGTGGVLIDQHARGGGLGLRVMARAGEAMIADGQVDFGYLGCREEVVPFYQRAGWQRIAATERHVSMHDPHEVVQSVAGPILILPIRDLDWPSGDIDLRGTPW